MAISEHIENVRERLRSNAYPSEAAVSQGILLPALQELGWPISDTRVVIPEFSLEGGRVDYALLHPETKPAVFIKVKNVGLLAGAERQLFGYASRLGVPMAILTDGREWSFYLPGEQGRYDERRVYKLDLLEQNLEDAANRLKRYLSYEKVCSGEALQAARSDYQTVARDRDIEATLPKAWDALLEGPDSLLLDILADKVEDLCGHKPDLDACARFLEYVSKPGVPTAISPPAPTSLPGKEPYKPEGGPSRSTVSYTFRGETHESNSARDVMCEVFRLLNREDPSFLEKFAALRHHGRTRRRYLARSREEVYPGRPDIAEKSSTEVVPGWYVGTNYGQTSIQKILTLALTVVPPSLRAEIQVNVVS